MERITKALELARLERERHPHQGGPMVASIPPRAAPAQQSRAVQVSSTHLEQKRLLHEGSSPETRNAYKMLRTQVLQRMGAHAFQALAAVSPGTAEGKSVTAANLALSIAQEPNHTAMLVDLDLRRPALHHLFGITVERGVDDYLAGECALSEVLYRPQQFERLVLLPVRAPVEHSSELLASTRARELKAEVRGRYPDRIVVYDLPPVLVSDDALTVMPSVDCALVVAAEGRTRRDELVRTLEVLNGTTIVGTVLNRSAEPASGSY